MAATEPITGTQGTIPRPAGPPPSTIQRPPGMNPGNRPPWAGARLQYPQAVSSAVRGTTNRLAVTPTGQANDALTYLQNYLAPFGLTSLANWAWGRYTALGGGQQALDQIQLELPDQQAYKDRFPAIEARAKAGLPQLTPAQYLQYEAGLDAELAKVGAPPGLRAGTTAFQHAVTQGLVGDVSLDEQSARIENGYAVIRNAPQSVRDYWTREFGVDPDHALAATFLNPEFALPTIQRMAREAQVGGAAAQSGVNLSLDRAGEIAAVNPGGDVSAQFGHLAELAPLFAERVSENRDLTAQGAGVGAEFGLDPNSQAEIQRRLDERKASVSGGGSSTSDNTGLTGYGEAR